MRLRSTAYSKLSVSLILVIACLLMPTTARAEGWEPPIPQPLPEVLEQPLIVYEVTTPYPDQHVVMTVTMFSAIQVAFRSIVEEDSYFFAESNHIVAIAEAADIANLSPNYGKTGARNETLDKITIYQGSISKSVTVAETSGRKATPQHLVNFLTYLRSIAIESGKYNEWDIEFPLPELVWTGSNSTDYTLTFSEYAMGFEGYMQLRSDGTGYFRNFVPNYIIQTPVVITPELQARINLLIKTSDSEERSYQSPSPDPTSIDLPIPMPTDGPYYQVNITQNGRTRNLNNYPFGPATDELFHTLYEIFNRYNDFLLYGDERLLVDVQAQDSSNQFWNMRISNTGAIQLDYSYFGQLSQQDLSDVIAIFNDPEWLSLEDEYNQNPKSDNDAYTRVEVNLAGHSKEVYAYSGADVPPAFDRILTRLAALYERTEADRLTPIGIGLIGMPRTGRPQPTEYWLLFVALATILVGLFVRRKTTLANTQSAI